MNCPVCNGEMRHNGKHGAWNTVRTKTITYTCLYCGLRVVFNKNNLRHKQYLGI